MPRQHSHWFTLKAVVAAIGFIGLLGLSAPVGHAEEVNNTSSIGLAGSLLDNVPDSIFEPETFALDNGLEVAVITNNRAPVAIQMLYYKVGSADDPRGRSGLAHYLEHLMFKGTERLGPGEFSEKIAAVGGTENAFTSYDFTGYFQIVAKEHLPMMMEFEADRMTNLQLEPEQVAAELKVVAEERRQVVDSRPSRRLGEAMDAILYA